MSLSILSRPFLPFTASKLTEMLNIEEMDWAQAGGQLLPEGHQIQPASLLFSKIEDEIIEFQVAKLG